MRIHVSSDYENEEREIRMHCCDDEWAGDKYRGPRFGADDSRHLSIGGRDWEIEKLGIRVRATTVYLFVRYGCRPEDDLEMEMGPFQIRKLIDKDEIA